MSILEEFCSICKCQTKRGTWQICLICEDCVICKDCFTEKRYTEHHQASHPIQTIPTVVDPTHMNYLCCPYGCESVFNVVELTQHCQQYHAKEGHKVRCPICAVRQVLNQQELFENSLLEHLMNDHEGVAGEFLPEASAILIIFTVLEETLSEDECPICLEEMLSDKLLLRCSQAFHNECMGLWLRIDNTCPMCRATTE